MLSRRPHVRFVDASRLFAGERATTFTDLWHFSDPGHEVLAELLAGSLIGFLQEDLDSGRSEG